MDKHSSAKAQEKAEIQKEVKEKMKVTDNSKEKYITMYSFIFKLMQRKGKEKGGRKGWERKGKEVNLNHKKKTKKNREL